MLLAVTLSMKKESSTVRFWHNVRLPTKSRHKSLSLIHISKAAYSTTVKNLVSAMQTNFRGANLLDAYDMPN